MRRLMAILAMLSFAFLGCATKLVKSPDEGGEKPDVLCNVIRPPVPLLMGTWQCYFVRNPERDIPDNNYVKYSLLKYGDSYGLYFYRTWKRGRKKVMEWKDWTINGREILGEPQFGVKIFAQGNDVYFTIRGLKAPAKMTRVVE